MSPTKRASGGWVPVAVSFTATCCIPAPNIWANGELAPMGVWYLGLLSPLTAPPFLLLLVAHVALSRLLARWVLMAFKGRLNAVEADEHRRPGPGAEGDPP